MNLFSAEIFLRSKSFQSKMKRANPILPGKLTLCEEVDPSAIPSHVEVFRKTASW